MPLPAHRVIPDGWEARHAPTAAGTMTGRCRITRPGGAPGEFDPDTGTVAAPAGAVVYEGPCRLVAVEADRALPVAEQRVTFREYLVQVPRTAADGVRVDDTVTVLESTDPALASAWLHVVDVQLGTLRFTRDLRVRLDQG
jgi:hypothetical protein